jgi:hypothetical protein
MPPRPASERLQKEAFLDRVRLEKSIVGRMASANIPTARRGYFRIITQCGVVVGHSSGESLACANDWIGHPVPYFLPQANHPNAGRRRTRFNHRLPQSHRYMLFLVFNVNHRF